MRFPFRFLFPSRRRHDQEGHPEEPGRDDRRGSADGPRPPGRALRSRRARQTAEEIRFYLEMRAREFERDGMSSREARRAALESFGNPSEIEAACAALEPESRNPGVTDVMLQLFRDFTLALRSFRRSPLFYASAIATAGLGIGANTAIFSIFNWAYLGAAPGIREADELRTLRAEGSASGSLRPWANGTYKVLRDGMRTVSGLVAFNQTPLHVSVNDDAERIQSEVVSGPYLSMLGLVPVHGRFFSREELEARGQFPVVVVSHRFWNRYFGETGTLDGAQVTVNGRTFVVIGVAPPGFHGAIKPGQADIWVSIAMHDVVLPTYADDLLDTHRSAVFFQLLGRVVPGASDAAIAQEAETLVRQIETTRPLLGEGGGVRVAKGASPFRFDAERLQRAYRLMTGVVVLVLLIAGANIANLLLARASARRRETAVQLALGVSRFQLVRRQLVESLCIAGSGAALGLLVAGGIIRMLRGNPLGGIGLSRVLPNLGDIPFDGRVFSFTLGVTVVTAVVIGLIPALATRQDPASELRGSRGSTGPGGSDPRSILAGVQMTVSMVLLVTAGLFLRTIANLGNIDYGIDGKRIMTFSIDPGTNGYEEDRVLQFYQDLLARVRAEPGVEAASVAWRNAFGTYAADASMRDPSQHAADDFPIDADMNTVGWGYFATLGADILEGRDYTVEEAYSVESRSLIINQSAGRALWPNGSAVGRTVELQYPEGATFTIVGVVEDVQLSNPVNPPEPAIYPTLAYAWTPTWVTISIRVAPGAVVRSVQAIVRELDPSLPVYDVGTIASQAEARFGEERFVAKLTGLFAGLAVLLAFVGLYGVASYSVQQRQRELGIRMALGARSEGIVRLVLRRAFTIAGVGAVAGVAGAIGVGLLIQNRLYGVEPVDPVSIAAAAVALTTGVVLASALPARRAARLDPVRVLRTE